MKGSIEIQTTEKATKFLSALEMLTNFHSMILFQKFSKQQLSPFFPLLSIFLPLSPSLPSSIKGALINLCSASAFKTHPHQNTYETSDSI